MIKVMKQLLRKVLETRKLWVMTDICKIMKAVDEVLAECLFIPRARGSSVVDQSKIDKSASLYLR